MRARDFDWSVGNVSYGPMHLQYKIKKLDQGRFETFEKYYSMSRLFYINSMFSGSSCSNFLLSFSFTIVRFAF